MVLGFLFTLPYRNYAGCRLAQMKPFACACDALFSQQGIQCDKKSSIEIAKIYNTLTYLKFKSKYISNIHCANHKCTC